MGDFIVISDGSGDLSPEIYREKGIVMIPFYVMLGSGEYLEQERDISTGEFYDWMVSHPGVYPKSSTPSTQDYLHIFTEHVQRGEKILCICITEKFSNSYQTARIARQMLLEDYPDAQVEVVNCMMNTVAQGLYVLEACRLRDAGVPLLEAVKRLEEIMPSGRIGKLAGKVSSVLGIRPIITLKEGEIFASGVCRGRGKSLDKVLSITEDYMKETFASPDKFEIALGYGYDRDEAVAFRNRVAGLLDSLGLHKDDIPIRHISSVISVHTGPYPLGICVLKKARLD